MDLSVLNMDGNTLGCCSIATLAALMHFRYPDVVSTGEKVVIFSSSERDPIPLSLHHYPVVTSFAIFEKKYIKINKINVYIYKLFTNF